MNRVLAFRAEVTLAAQLVTRHRVPRLVLLLAAILVAAMLGNASAPDSTRQATVLLIAGSLGAVAGSRLLAYGGPLAAARLAGSGVIPPVGRLLGAMLLAGPILLAVSIATVSAAGPVASTVLIAATYAAVTAALTMALAPVVGASGAAALGFMSALGGGARPSQVGALLAGWPFLRTPAVLFWNALPLPWRAARWLAGGPGFADPAVFLFWLAIGLATSAWAVERFVEHRERAGP